MWTCDVSVEANQDLSRWSCGLTTWQRAAFVFWAHFQHETLPLVSGLTRGRPCLYLFTTRSLSRPVHTCSSGSLHHFQLFQLLLRSSPLQENMIIELLALFTHQLRNMVRKVGRTFSGAEAAAGDCPGPTRSQQLEHVGTFRRGAEPKHISPW